MTEDAVWPVDLLIFCSFVQSSADILTDNIFSFLIPFITQSYPILQLKINFNKVPLCMTTIAPLSMPNIGPCQGRFPPLNPLSIKSKVLLAFDRRVFWGVCSLLLFLRIGLLDIEVVTDHGATLALHSHHHAQIGVLVDFL